VSKGHGMSDGIKNHLRPSSTLHTPPVPTALAVLETSTELTAAAITRVLDTMTGCFDLSCLFTVTTCLCFTLPLVLIIAFACSKLPDILLIQNLFGDAVDMPTRGRGDCSRLSGLASAEARRQASEEVRDISERRRRRASLCAG